MPVSLSEQVTAELRAEIGRQRLTHTELARRMGVTQPTVTRWVNGTNRLDLDDFERLCRALDLPPERFLRAPEDAA
jgi:transcriptional regulator with XRE-family HTH domain